MLLRKRCLGALLVALTLVGASGAARAQSAPGTSYTPRVPVSQLAAPVSWLDPSRLHVSTSISVGSGFQSGPGMNGLQVTRLSYSFAQPLWMSVSVGNAFGGSSGLRGNGSSLFLEGLEVGMRPLPNFLIQVHYQNLRSPLQLNDRNDFWAR